MVPTLQEGLRLSFPVQQEQLMTKGWRQEWVVVVRDVGLAIAGAQNPWGKRYQPTKICFII